jgi:hypothetical protein
MNKNCVFCGQKPQNKNNEHILPKWLLELTGDPKRITTIGQDWSTEKILSFSYDSMVFPSCESCNNRYSELEGHVKIVIDKIFSYEYLSTDEITLLLDWFDKVRIGLWIGYQYLSKNAFKVEPKFYINQRIRQKDRFIVINDLDNLNKGLSLIGVNTPFFHYYPICFTLVINNKVFTNVSTDYATSYATGLPYPKKAYVNNDNRFTEFELEKGTQKLNKRILRFPLLRPYLLLGQAIVNEGIIDRMPHLYNESYSNDLWQKNIRGLGRIFSESNGILSWLDEEKEITVDLRDHDKPRMLRVDIQTFKLQNYLHENNLISDERLNEEFRQNFRLAGKFMRTFNNKAIAQLLK